MSVCMFFCGPHLPLASQFVSLCLAAPPQAAAGCNTNSCFSRRTTFRNNCQPYGIGGKMRGKRPFSKPVVRSAHDGETTFLLQNELRSNIIEILLRYYCLTTFISAHTYKKSELKEA